jgi:hypothetical protein
MLHNLVQSQVLKLHIIINSAAAPPDTQYAFNSAAALLPTVSGISLASSVSDTIRIDATVLGVLTGIPARAVVDVSDLSGFAWCHEISLVDCRVGARSGDTSFLGIARNMSVRNA